MNIINRYIGSSAPRTHHAALSRRAFKMLLAVLIVGNAHAQNVLSEPTDKDRSGETPIELSPFRVDVDKDVGYLAGNTLAGSRLNTPLRDTAASLSVLTAEFLKDIAATNLTEALEWTTNSQFNRGEGGNDNTVFANFDQFRVRGLPATVTRNYFAWRLPVDTYNIDRVEEARGPNSILFGIGSAGGVVNSTTKQPLSGRSFRSAVGTVGSYGSYRGSFDINQSVMRGKLAVRVNAVYDHGESDRLFAYSNQRRIHVGAAYQVTPKIRVRTEYETGDIHQNIAAPNTEYDGMLRWRAKGSPTFATPVPSNSDLGINRYGSGARITLIEGGGFMNLASRNFTTNTNDILTDETIASRTINTGGPSQLRDANFNAFSAFVDHEITKNIYLELAYNHQDNKSKAYQIPGSNRALMADPNQFLPTGAPNPNVGRLFHEGNWIRYYSDQRSDNARASISSTFDLGKWGNYRVAAMAEREWRVSRGGTEGEVWEGAPFSINPEAATNIVYRRNYVSEGDWSTYIINGPTTSGPIKGMLDPVTGRTLTSTWIRNGSSQDDDPQYQTTFLVGGQARFLKDRVVLGLGVRKDKLDITDRGVVRNPGTNIYEVDYTKAALSSYEGTTKTLGAVVHVTKDISVFYNRSDNFNLPNIGVRLLPDGKIPPTPQGEGEDMGIAFELLKDRVYIRATRFETSEVKAHDFRYGGSQTNPSSIANEILDTLIAEGVITTAQGESHRRTSTGSIFDRVVEGYELNVTGNITKNWRIQANYSYSEGYEDNIGPEVKEWAATELPYYKGFNQNLVTARNRTIGAAILRFETELYDQTTFEGLMLRFNRPYKVNVFTNYTFSSGPLRGLEVGGGYRHQSKSTIGRYTTFPDTGNFLTPEEMIEAVARTGQVIYGNSYWLATARLAYTFRNLPWVKRLTLQLNVDNVFDYDDPLINGIYADGRFAFGYKDRRLAVNRWSLVTPRAWRLSASVDF